MTRHLSIYTTVYVVEDGQLLDHRDAAARGSNIEALRREAHDQLDAAVLGLAEQLPESGPELEDVGRLPGPEDIGL